MESVWFFFWWSPLLSVDCFHKLCLSGTPSENSQMGWDLGNRIAWGYQFDGNWISPMEVMPEVFKCSVREMRWVYCSRNEAPPHFLNRTLNTSGITPHETDSLCIKPITLGHPIPKISTPQDYFLRRCLEDRVCESIPQTREDIIRKGIRWIPQEMLNRVMDNFNVGVAAVLSYSSAVYGTNIVLITEKI